MAEELERIYTIPLKKNNHKRSKAAPTAVKRVKKYLTKHMKVEENKIWIDDSLNNVLWSKGKYSMPGKIRVKAVKFDDGVVEAYLPELDFKKSRREILKEEKDKKAPILRTEEEVEGEETDGEDYEIAPAADGDVKIKKKKPKEKEDKEEKKEKDKTEEKTTEKKEKKTKEKTSKAKSKKDNKKKSASKSTKSKKQDTKKKSVSKSTKSKSSSKSSGKTETKKKSESK